MEIKDKIKEIRSDFPILSRKIKGKPLVYLDNASTTQKPLSVINAESNFYKNNNSNVHRALYTIGVEATEKYNLARKAVSEFINADENEIVFTKGTTESLNLLSYTIPAIFPKGKDEIVLSELEHHSNLVPWQEAAKRAGLKLKFISIKPDLSLDYQDAEKKISTQTALVCITHKSNVTGTDIDINKIVKLAHAKGALVVVDAAQTAGHLPLDVKKLDCDFLAFSAHKIYGPTGLGVLFGKSNLLNKLSPFNFGGSMIESVSFSSSTWAPVPLKFEAGTPNVAGAIGLAESIKYLNKLGITNIEKREKSLSQYAVKSLLSIKGIKILSAGSGVISFNLDKVHPHDVASLLNDYNICIRAGHHCTMPLMNKLGLPGTCRISLSFYNTEEEIDYLIKALKEISGVFKNG